MSNPYAPPPPGPRRGGGGTGRGHGSNDTLTSPDGAPPRDVRPGDRPGDRPADEPTGQAPTDHRPVGEETAERPPAHPDRMAQDRSATDPPPRPPVDPEVARAAGRRVMHFGVFMIATLVTASLPLPWQAASVAFAVGAVVVGVRALWAVWRSGTRGPLVAVLGVAVGFSTVMSLSLTLLLALWPVQMERQECLQRALTISAEDACEQQYQESLSERLGQQTGD